MTAQLILAWFVRLVHIGSAIAAIGAPFYIRFALMPAAAATLDEETHQKLREAISKRWSKFVYLLITLFLVTGFFNFFVEIRLPPEPGQALGKLITARWKDFSPHDKQTYHMLFGIKVLSAFIIFFLASALAGRSKALAAIRKNARTAVTILLLLGGLVLVCATLMHYQPIPSSNVDVIPLVPGQ